MLSRVGLEISSSLNPAKACIPREDSCFRGGFDGGKMLKSGRESMAPHLCRYLGLFQPCFDGLGDNSKPFSQWAASSRALIHAVS